MGAVGEKALEPFFGLRHRIGLGDADGVEADFSRLLRERRPDLGCVQKSRSA
jgi:hypothetical protein